MSQQTRARSKEAAAYLKKMKIERKTGMCPWGCGTRITNGGTHLLNHLTTCRGKLPRAYRDH